jgi:uncharacterized protein YigA (DUF484 family)
VSAQNLNVQGITEDDIAHYLANTPGFFERHADLLSTIQLTSPHGQRAVSLQERQMEMLRERIKGMEFKLLEMLRHGQENTALADRLHRFTQALLLTPQAADLPSVLCEALAREFFIPQVGLRLWNLEARFQQAAFAQDVSADTQRLAASLNQPYCGMNAGFEPVTWLREDGTPARVASVALIRLKVAASPEAFGLLVLGSPDPTRYSADMGTEFLARLGEVASAALSRLLPQSDRDEPLPELPLAD